MYRCLLQKGIREWLWMTMRIGNAGSGLDGGLALRCQNSGESQLPCLTLPWQRDTNQGFRRVKEQECQSAAFPRNCHDISPCLVVQQPQPWFPSGRLSLALPAGIALCAPAARESRGFLSPSSSSALELSSSLVLCWSRDGVRHGNGFPGSLHCR